MTKGNSNFSKSTAKRVDGSLKFWKITKQNKLSAIFNLARIVNPQGTCEGFWPLPWKNTHYQFQWWYLVPMSTICSVNMLTSSDCYFFSACKALAAATAAKSLQSCSTLCNPIDGSLSGSLVPGILQARTLEWVAISFSNAWKWKVKVKSLSHVRLFATSWTAAYQAPPSMGRPRQEYWSGLPLPSPTLH